jgi:YidC/Oxa1 family membrane protein insertase
MNENRNLILAVILAGAVLLGWNYFVLMPQQQAEKAHQAQLLQQQKAAERTRRTQVPTQEHTNGTPADVIANLSRGAALKLDGPRVAIDTPSLDGSIRLQGARFDDLRFKNYRETVDPKSPEVGLLSPSHTAHPYYAVYGWLGASGVNTKVPDDSTPWKLVSGTKLTPATPVVLQWANDQGLVFTRKVAVDDRFLFSVTDSVDNKGAKPVTLHPYAYVAHDGLPAEKGTWILHEGFVGVAGGGLKDPSFECNGTFDWMFGCEPPPLSYSSTGGWFGFTDKYWMTALVPPQNVVSNGCYLASDSQPEQPGATQKCSATGDGEAVPSVYASDSNASKVSVYQAGYTLGWRVIQPGSDTTVTQQMFAGAKIISVLQSYEDKYGIQKLHLAVDWGWFWFFAQPIFYALDFFYHYLGNFGLAILLLTVLIKLALFPLADASYRSMSRMKKLQPKVEQIRERFAEDKVRQQQEMMELYKREKANPLSGCLPTLIQIPVFFSLYKVIYVTIEMRQAPFFGWVRDLSAADPTTFLNLFGLLPYSIPSFVPALLHVGIWPILMGMTQWVQTKMNPAPADPVQQRMFAYMPLMFMFMLANMPAGLVIYWTWNNLLTVTQQYVVMRRQGVEIHLFNNLKLPDSIRRLAGGGARANTHPGE